MQNLISDQNIRLEALNARQSFIVQAPAGSGKTGLLTQRLLVLLAQVEEGPEEILALTFTKKAAVEMKDRILCALERAASPIAPSDPYEHKTWELARELLKRDKNQSWDLRQNPNRLKIQTIDSLCASITRQMPVTSLFGSTPKIREDASVLYNQAAENLLKSLESKEAWSKNIAILLKHLDNNLTLAQRLLAEMLSHRDQWLPFLGQFFSKEASRDLLEGSLKNVIQESLAALYASIPSGFEEILELADFAAHHLELSSTETSILSRITSLQDWPGCELNDLPLWQSLGELLLTKENQWRKTVTHQQGFPAPSSTAHKEDKEHFRSMKERMNHCLARLADYPEFQQNLRKMRECPPPFYPDKQWQIVLALVQLLPLLTAELLLVFREAGEVDFTEITLAAQKALGEFDAPSDLALGLDYRIRHILVDEFQDTSLTQFRLIEQLTAGWQPDDGRTLFLVGDPMQSIYRFRQAEVGLFIRAKQKGIGEIKLKSLILSSNFRSDPTLVEWVNTYFKEKFPKHDDITSSAIAFTASSAVRKAHSGIVATLEAVTLETEGEMVAETILKHQTEDKDGSIAVLVRSRSHLRHILPGLRTRQIAYQGIQLDILSDQSIVQDLLSLTRALLHCGDRIAWLAIFRTPWGRLSLSDLLLIANHDPDLSIWDTVQSYSLIRGLSDAALERLAAMVPVLRDAFLQAERLPLRTWVFKTWVALGGSDFLYDQNSIQDIEAFFEILEEPQINFYESGVLEERVLALYSKVSEPAKNAVQIMTIHKAKGLEFDTVIVPGIGRRSKSDQIQLLLWEERISTLKDSYLILAPIKSVAEEKDQIYSFLKRQEEQRAAYEATRLWYVAATRAKKHLYWLSHELPPPL